MYQRKARHGSQVIVYFTEQDFCHFLSLKCDVKVQRRLRFLHAIGGILLLLQANWKKQLDISSTSCISLVTLVKPCLCSSRHCPPHSSGLSAKHTLWSSRKRAVPPCGKQKGRRRILIEFLAQVRNSIFTIFRTRPNVKVFILIFLMFRDALDCQIDFSIDFSSSPWQVCLFCCCCFVVVFFGGGGAQ